MKKTMIILALVFSVLAAGCVGPTGQATGCQQNWVRQDIAVLNDDSGQAACKTHCFDTYRSNVYKIVKETVLESGCYCDLNKC